MRSTLLLCLVAAEVFAAPRIFNRGCDVSSRRSGRGGVACSSLAFFEFAPANGAGMGVPCACAAPTGAKGEALTFSRASTGYCTKGNETTGIVNGDLVECASGQPRVMPGGDGTGGLGLSVWEARTNGMLRSQEFENAAWTPNGLGAAAPTITANAATAPDGTVTADRVQFSATSAGQNSILFQDGCPASGAPASAGVYVLGNGSSGTLKVGVYDGATWQTSLVAFSATTWTRMIKENVTAAAGTTLMLVGNYNAISGTAAAADVFLWQGDCQGGATISPPIKTVGTTATRVAELADVALTFGSGTTGFSSSGSYIAAKLQNGSSAPIGVLGTGVPGVDIGSVNASYPYACGGGSLYCLDVNPVTPNGYASVASLPLPDAVQHRAVAYFDGALLNGCVDGLCGAGQGGTWSAPAWTRWRIGNYTSAAGSMNGVIKRLCLDPSPTRCR